MRSWIAKIWLFVAVIIITAHNTIPHDHDHITLAAHHDHDDGDDDDHNVFSSDFLAHSFTQQAAIYKFVKQVVADKPIVTLATVEVAVGNYSCVTKSQYFAKHEFPPPRLYFSSSGFCGPPYIV